MGRDETRSARESSGFSRGYLMSRSLSAATAVVICASCAGKIALEQSELPPSGRFISGQDVAGVALRTADGNHPSFTLIWKKRFISGVGASPVIIGEIVLIPFLNGEVVALQLSNGAKAGRRKFADGPIFGLSVSDGVLYVSTSQQRESLYGYDLRSGRRMWSAAMGSVESAAVAEGERLYVGSRNHGLYCVNGKDGSTLWAEKSEAPLVSSGALDSGSVIYCNQEGLAFRRDGRDGRLIWERQLEYGSTPEPEKPYSPVVVNNHSVFVTTLKGSVFALDAGDGSFLWRTELGDPIYASVSVASETVIVATSSGTVYALREDNGNLIWNYDAESIINERIVKLDSLLVVTTQRGDIILLKESDGSRIWKGAIRSRIVAKSVSQMGYLVVAGDDKWVYGFAISAEEEK